MPAPPYPLCLLWFWMRHLYDLPMNIKLVGALPRELKELGLKPGMKFQDVQQAAGYPEGSVIINWMDDGQQLRAVVTKYNYDTYNKYLKFKLL